MRHWLCAAMLLVLLSAGSTHVLAQTRDQQTCAQASGQEAIDACSRAIVADPRDAVTFFNRGVAWYNKGHHDKAIADYNKTIEIDPTLAVAFYARGKAWFDKGDFDKAITNYGKAIDINSQYASAFVHRGVSWAHKGDFDKAITDYDKAIEIKPNYTYALNGRGLAWQGKGDYNKAIADFTRAIAIDPMYSVAFYNRGNAWYYKNDYNKAISDYNKALETAPKFALAFKNRGLAWEEMKNIPSALADFESYAKLKPDDPDASVAIARVKNKLAATNQVATQAQSAQSQSQQVAANTTATVVSTKRVALLIGNSRYKHAPRLENPSNDVRLLERTLKQIGFSSVTVKTDLTTDELRKALQEFSVIAESADFAMIHYAGHAIQVGGINYVIPVDARIRTDRDIDFETIDANKFMSALTGAKKLRVLVLDACRNNPFEENMRRTVASRSIGRGLGRMEAESGEMIVFAARAGQVALDGQGSLSPFAESFAQRLSQTPAIDVRRIFDFVRDDVLAKTSGKQQPFTYASLPSTEDFYFSR